MTIQFGHNRITRYDGSTPESWLRYICGHCGADVSGVVIGSIGEVGKTPKFGWWLQCPSCYRPSAQWQESIFPGVSFGPTLQGLPEPVEATYEEARRCFSSNAYTAVELICRKILMHVACDKGAPEGKTFASYLDYLESAGYVTPAMRDWVKLIKDHGNDATHRLETPDKGRAASTMLFTIQLLRTVYEMSYIASQFAVKPE
jgi:Domain of unknown function (DUF4145)